MRSYVYLVVRAGADYLANVGFVEFEGIFVAFFEWILPSIGFLQLMLGDLALVTVHREVNLGIRACTGHRARLNGNDIGCAYIEIKPFVSQCALIKMILSLLLGSVVGFTGSNNQ